MICHATDARRVGVHRPRWLRAREHMAQAPVIAITCSDLMRLGLARPDRGARGIQRGDVHPLQRPLRVASSGGMNRPPSGSW
jgi:hypothetical protein